MLQVMSGNWWVPTLRGAIAVLFGIGAFVYPLFVSVLGVALFAAFAFVEGVFALVAAFGLGLPASQRTLLVLAGLLGLAVGAAAVLFPALAALSLVVFVGWWSIVSGVFQIIVAIEYRKVIEGEWLLALSGALSIIFGGLLVWMPGVGLITLTWIFGAYAIVIGLMLVGLGLKLRSLQTSLR